jgi:OOP family OmpA-OmpF porin
MVILLIKNLLLIRLDKGDSKMLIKKTVLWRFISSLIIFAILATSSAYAERETVPGYVSDSNGTIMRDSAGNCMHSSSWTPEKAVVVGCDGVVLRAPIVGLKGGSTGVGTAIVIPAASMFAFDSAELTTRGKVDLLVQRSKIKPELAQAFVAVIVGYTDSKGNAKHNLKLSKQRAEAVRDFLIAGGIASNKLRAVGKGAQDPIASNDTEEGRAKNRRVEVVVFGEARGLDVMHFPSVALFPKKSSELTMRGKKLLVKNSLVAMDNMTRSVYIEVIGHTDDVGDKKENQKLSEQRAQSVRNSLIRAGVNPSKIMTVGAGASQPIASNQTEEGREQNRRVEVVILGRMR